MSGSSTSALARMESRSASATPIEDVMPILQLVGAGGRTRRP